MNNAYGKYIAYIGTYTSGKGEGIYIFELDAATGKLTQTGVSKLENPSYLTVDSRCRYLYAVVESDEFEGKNGGAVCAFSINSKTGGLELLNCQPTKGVAPCHICTDSSGKYLFAANYGEGTITAFPIATDGSIEPHSSIIQHQGSGPNPDRQEKPHAHYVTLTPDEKHLCAVDLGIDRIMVYGFDMQNGCLIPDESLYVTLKPGSGPRHMEFHPNGKFAYLINELDSEIVVLGYSPSDSTFHKLQCISALPEGYTGISYGAAVHISPDGNFLYVSNRGHDSIGVFRVEKATGSLELVSHFPTHGKFPRDFALDPTGKFLFVANQNSDTIVQFEINCETGELERVGDIIEVPIPVCVKFVKIEA